jgi:hypothetical protein
MLIFLTWWRSVRTEGGRVREFRETGSRVSRSVADDACSDYETLVEAGKPKDWAAAQGCRFRNFWRAVLTPRH